MSGIDGYIVREDLNIAYTRRRFLKPLLSDNELHPLVGLELLCFPPPANYDLRTLRDFCRQNGSLVFRVFPQDKPDSLAAFHIVNTLYGELVTLDVHPDHRRCGIGRMLVMRSLEALKRVGHKDATCQIATSNEPSLKLHIDLGFKKRRIIRNYYGPGHDAFLLRIRF